MSPPASLILIEPFYGGSHKELVDLLHKEYTGQVVVYLYTLPAKKWHWKARTSALYFSQIIPINMEREGTLFASSVLNLAELVALRPDLANLHKVLYFHENDLVYPVRDVKERDFQYGYNQILSCMVADVVAFNSSYNLRSFLDNINMFLKLIPDNRPKGVREKIEPICQVLSYPICFDRASFVASRVREKDCKLLRIVWPHRWEHDKNPEAFFKVLFSIQDQNLPFELYVLGERFSEVPEIFDLAKIRLKNQIKHWGYTQSKADYYRILKNCDVVVSTANHEFFGVAMLEAVYLGCYPLAPNRLVYADMYPDQYLYNTYKELETKLKKIIRNPQMIRDHNIEFDIAEFDWTTLRVQYSNVLKIT